MVRRTDDTLRCSFCGKSQNEVKKLIAGPTVYICNECIDICNEIITDDQQAESVASRPPLPKPGEIKDFLDEYVIGQDETKKRLAVAVYQHYKRIELARRRSDVEIQKSNIVLIGPTGTVANVPPQGGRKHPHQEFFPVDTTNILFICGGAFVGLEKVVERRLRNKSLGFHAEVKSGSQRQAEALAHVQPEDLIRYGLIPEFVGRLPVVGVLHELDEAALIKILTDPKNALVKQYQKKFDFDSVKLRFTDDSLRRVAQQAVARKVGARGLMMILEELLLEAMYTLPSQKRIKEFVITSEMVERHRAIPGEGLAGVDDAAA